MVYIGTSGFYYKHWKTRFYPLDLKQKDWFLYYAHYFNTVELNVTFYNLPKEETFHAWAKNSPSDFKFCLKGSRFITHQKRLKDVDEAVSNYFTAIKGIKNKTGCILWQFPASFKVNPERFKEFLIKIDKYDYINVFEFRNESWLNDEIYEIAKSYNASIAYIDSPTLKIHPKITSNVYYFRFHGSSNLYSSLYSDEELEFFANLIQNVLPKVKNIYVYFNNDAEGNAVLNALKLKEFL